MRNTLSFCLLAAFLATMAPCAGAAEGNWRIGLKAGALSEKKFDHTKTKTGTPGGFELARKLGDKAEAGFSYTYAEMNYESLLLPIKFTFYDHFFLLFGNYQLGRGFYAGPQLGFVSRSLKKERNNIGLDSLAAGFRAGYDYSLTERLGIGLQAQYVNTGKAEKTVRDNNADVTYSVAPTYFYLTLLNMSYRF